MKVSLDFWLRKQAFCWLCGRFAENTNADSALQSCGVSTLCPKRPTARLTSHGMSTGGRRNDVFCVSDGACKCSDSQWTRELAPKSEFFANVCSSSYLCVRMFPKQQTSIKPPLGPREKGVLRMCEPAPSKEEDGQDLSVQKGGN